MFVCNDKKVAELRRVRLGQLVEEMRVVEKGLTAGDKVIVNGLQRVRPGAQVNPTNGWRNRPPAIEGGKPATN